MIEKYVASRRKTTIISYPPFKDRKAISGIVPSMMNEAKRRDAICVALGKECNYKIGDVVVPVFPSEYEKIGECRVSFIADTYAKLGPHNVWPADDSPMIVSIWSKKLSKSFICNPAYVKKKEA